MFWKPLCLSKGQFTAKGNNLKKNKIEKQKHGKRKQRTKKRKKETKAGKLEILPKGSK